jgi:hypothetical protein
MDRNRLTVHGRIHCLSYIARCSRSLLLEVTPGVSTVQNQDYLLFAVLRLAFCFHYYDVTTYPEAKALF